jgi:hypothetical protein
MAILFDPDRELALALLAIPRQREGHKVKGEFPFQIK